MITVTRTCDRCKGEVPAKDQLWNVAVNIECYPKTANKIAYIAPQAQWCRPCTVAMGLLGNPEEQKATPELSPPTLEDQIREIIRSEMEGHRHD